MRAMVLAAGLGTRLRPLTYEITKPMVPVLDRPVMAHILDLLDRHGFDEVIANLHYFPDSIREHFGERLTIATSPSCSAPPAGVRACAEFFGDEPFLVISGDALTDIDLDGARRPAPRGRRDRHAGRQAGPRHARVRRRAARPRRADHRLPGEARARRGALGPRQLRHLRVRAARSSTTSPSARSWTGRRTCSRRCSRTTCRSTSTRSASTGTTSARWRSCARARSTRCAGELRLEIEGEEVAPGVVAGRRAAALPADAEIEGPAWIGRDVQIGAGVRLMGRRARRRRRVGDGAQLRETIVLPGHRGRRGVDPDRRDRRSRGILESLRAR